MPAEAMLPSVTRVLDPTAPIASDVLLTGDPARAMALAQQLTTDPKMANHAHGLWGYSGDTAAGWPLTIQSTGIGGPSAALVLADLAEAGATRAVRVGTCVALDGDLAIATMLLCGRALAADGTSRALGADVAADADPVLTGALSSALDASPSASTVVSTDLIAVNGGAPPPAMREQWLNAGAVAAEMQAAALFALAPRLGMQVAALLVVADDSEGRPGSAGELDDAAVAAAELATRTLEDQPA
jgi:uridine phosphorylase